MGTRMHRFFALMAICFLPIGADGADGLAQTKMAQAESPLRILEFSIPMDGANFLHAQLRAYAEKYAFAIRIAPTTPDNAHIIVEMWREDVKILGVNPERPDRFKGGFYKNNTPSVDEHLLDGLVNGLTESLKEIRGVVIVGG